LPPIDEQRAIADRIDQECQQLDAATLTARRGVDLARERRAALISAAVTGKIDMGVAA
jgi:type I restriction enzyme S subunit